MARVPIPIWHGTTEEARDLTTAILHNCACTTTQRCGAHAAMLDQRFADGVLFARYLRERLEHEEGLGCLDI